MAQGDLDPKDWDAFRAEAHKMVDRAVDKMATSTEGRVWSPLPAELKAAIEEPLPLGAQTPAQVAERIASVMPYGVGNTHPRFFGWVHGAGAPGGVLADIAAAAMNVNAGGRDHVAPVVERQVIAWCAEMMGMPAGTSGLIASGTSMATVIALKTARDRLTQFANRKTGGAGAKLVGYTSIQAHSCVAQAFDILGLGTDALRKVPSNDAFEMDMDALASMVAADKAAGLQPFMLAGTAGAVNMGAIDDLEAQADFAAANDMWFHIDGAFGATAVLGEHAKDRLSGLARADSLAFDFHKWFQVNYEGACVLIRDEAAHKNTFSDRPEYLRGSERGLAGGAFWAVDYGPDLSRGFRALRVWAHFLEHGVDKLGKTIDRNIELAQYLGKLVQDHPDFELIAPVPLNIVCFAHKGGADVSEDIVYTLQEKGIAVPSTTLLNGRMAIRCNITNHRTRESDLDMLIAEAAKIGGAKS